LRHRSMPIFSVQYHPEASPGPHDSAYLFEKFVNMMEEFAHPRPQEEVWRRRRD
jgi:carbamoyl-phosphate synthase small subunit